MNRLQRLAAIVPLLAAVSCYSVVYEGDPLDPDLVQLDHDQLFTLAAGYYDVPKDLLIALAWHESSFAPEELGEGPHEHRPAHGWMGLTPDRIAWAAELTGAPAELLETSRESNVMAGAVILGALRDQISPDAPADHVDVRWWPVIVAWSEFGDEWLDHDFARDVFYTLQLGLETTTPDGEAVFLAGRRIPGLESVDYVAPPIGEDEARETIGYPGRARVVHAHSGNQSSRSNGTNSISRVVLHTTQGSYNGAISWFQNNSSNVSAHYVLRRSDGEVTQMVSDHRKAWHACNNNNDTIGIEHEGTAYSSSQWTPALLDSSAQLTAWLVTQYDIPIDRDHIVGHGEIQPAGCAGRDDPGVYFPWDDYLQMVADYAGGVAPDPGGGDEGGDEGGGGAPGPLTFLQPGDGQVVTSPVSVTVQHPHSHIELWSGPAMLVAYNFDHPAHEEVEFDNGARNLTARAYRLSGAWAGTRSVWVDVVSELPSEDDPPEDDGPPADDPPVDTSLHATFELPIGGSTLRFSATAGAGVARVEYYIDGWRLNEDVTGDDWGTPTDYDLTYTFNYAGLRSLEAKAYDAAGNLTDTLSKQILVPEASDDAGCASANCVASFPYNTSGSTSTSSLDAWDSYSCAPSTNEGGPEVIYEVQVPESGWLQAGVSDGYGVDVDVHILSALSTYDCVARDNHSAGTSVTAGTWYVVVDTWVSASGTVYDGAYDLTITFSP